MCCQECAGWLSALRAEDASASELQLRQLELQQIWSQIASGVGCAGFSHDVHKIDRSHIYFGCTLQQQHQNSPDDVLAPASTAWQYLISRGSRNVVEKVRKGHRQSKERVNPGTRIGDSTYLEVPCSGFETTIRAQVTCKALLAADCCQVEQDGCLLVRNTV